MTTETATTAATIEAEGYPWDAPDSPTIYASIHILAQAPAVTFGAGTYPFVTLRGGLTLGSDVTVSLTGDAAQRAAFTAALRDVADAIDGWTE